MPRSMGPARPVTLTRTRASSRPVISRRPPRRRPSLAAAGEPCRLGLLRAASGGEGAAHGLLGLPRPRRLEAIALRSCEERLPARWRARARRVQPLPQGRRLRGRFGRMCFLPLRSALGPVRKRDVHELPRRCRLEEGEVRSSRYRLRVERPARGSPMLLLSFRGAASAGFRRAAAAATRTRTLAHSDWHANAVTPLPAGRHRRSAMGSSSSRSGAPTRPSIAPPAIGTRSPGR